MLLAFVLGGMVAGGISLLSLLGAAYPCFTIPVVLPISYRMLAAGDEVHTIMGLMILVFGTAMLAAAMQMSRFFRTMVDLQLQLSSSREVGQALERMLRVDELTGIATPSDLLRASDNALYQAKRQGRCRLAIAGGQD
jgi:predicted signal transduction protein with EAL and GGDEF domain